MSENYNEMNQNIPPQEESSEFVVAPEETLVTPPSPKKDGATGKTVAALVLGITSVALGVTVFLGLFGLACGVVGLILAIRERKEHPSGLATASFILSIVGLVIGVLSTATCVGCLGLFSLIGSDYYTVPYFHHDFFDTIQHF